MIISERKGSCLPYSRKKELSAYRMEGARETIEVAEDCCNGKHYRDAINRSYYAAFYAVKAVLALDERDFKRHKDVIAYFNQNYVASEILPKDIGRKIARLQQRREKSDYDDFYIASKEEAEEQIGNAKSIIAAIQDYLVRKEEKKE